MVAWPEDAQHLARTEHRGDRVEAARESLADDHNVRRNSLVHRGEQLPRAPQAGLDLVGYQQHIVLAADRRSLPQVALRRHDDPRLALDRLH